MVVGLAAGGLALARNLRALGCRVIGLYQDPLEAGRFSSSFDRVWRWDATLAQMESLAESFGAERVLVVPTSDAALAWLSASRQVITPRIVPALPPPDIMASWFDKSRYAIASPLERILDAPRTRLLSACRAASPGDGAWMAKPVSVVSPARRRIGKAVFLSDAAALDRFAREHAEVADGIIVQEWIPGDDGAHGFCGGYADARGDIHWVHTGRKVWQSPKGCGVSVLARRASIPLLDEKTRALVERIGHRGFFEVEWKWDERRQAWRFLEINIRLWMTISMSRGDGMALTQRLLSDYDIPASAPPRRRFDREPMEWRDDVSLLSQCWKRRQPIPVPVQRPVAHAFWSLSDPLPFFAETWNRLSQAALRRLRGLPHG